jgi:hypothetical protein
MERLLSEVALRVALRHLVLIEVGSERIDGFLPHPTAGLHHLLARLNGSKHSLHWLLLPHQEHSLQVRLQLIKNNLELQLAERLPHYDTLELVRFQGMA